MPIPSISNQTVEAATENIRPHMSQGAKYFFSFVAVMTWVFVVYRSYIHQPWRLDDFDYLKRPPLNLHYAINYWDPRWGWYFRPIFNTYIDLVMTVFHRSSPAVHAAGIAVTGIIFWLLGVLAYRLAGFWPAVLTVVLFTLAPHKDEAIWWPAGSNTLMAAVFSLATLVLWHIWATNHKRRYFVVAMVTLLFALGGKEESFALALTLPILDFYVRPRLRLTTRLKAFVPVYAILGICALCTHIAYGYAIKADSKGALFAFEPVRRTFILLHFATFSFIGSYFQLPSEATLVNWISPFVLIAIALQRRDRLSGMLMAIALVVTLPNPLGTGIHSASERFNFLNAGMTALAYSVGFLRLAQSNKLTTRLVAAAIAINFLISRFDYWDTNDPLTIWCISFVILALGFIGWRANVVKVTDYVMGCIAIVSASLLPLVTVTPVEVSLTIATFVGGALAMRRQDWLAGAVITVLLVNLSYVAVPVYWIWSFASRRKATLSERGAASLAAPTAGIL